MIVYIHAGSLLQSGEDTQAQGAAQGQRVTRQTAAEGPAAAG